MLSARDRSLIKHAARLCGHETISFEGWLRDGNREAGLLIDCGDRAGFGYTKSANEARMDFDPLQSWHDLETLFFSPRDICELIAKHTGWEEPKQEGKG